MQHGELKRNIAVRVYLVVKSDEADGSARCKAEVTVATCNHRHVLCDKDVTSCHKCARGL